MSYKPQHDPIYNPQSQLNLTQVNDVEVIKDTCLGTQMGSKGPKWAI